MENVLSQVLTGRAHRSVFGDFVLMAFIAVQLCDGAFTYVGVHALGPAAEANPIVASYMAILGTGAALFLTKGLAIGCAAILHLLGRHRTIAVLTVIYLIFAVWPWSLVFAMVSL